MLPPSIRPLGLGLGILMIVSPLAPAQGETKNVLMIAGKPSHRYGAHEHFAGLKILQEALQKSVDNIWVDVVKGWPEDETLVRQADSIVIYCDGGRRHLAIEHLDALRKKLKTGCGLACLHYAVEMMPG